MAWEGDFTYLRRLIDRGVVAGSVLEVGSHNHIGGDEGNARATCERAGLTWEGADIDPGPGVDFVLDILDRPSLASLERRWTSVLVFNVLEHVFEPITALRNAVALAEPGGTVVAASPVIWDLHDYPGDYWRPMPGFFVEFARREGLDVVAGSATWLLDGMLLPLEALREGAQYLAPSARHGRALHGPRRRVVTDALQRACGLVSKRAYVFPFCSFAIALRRPA